MSPHDFARAPGDQEEVRLEKTTIFIVASLTTVAGVIWFVTYLLVYGWGLVTVLPLIGSTLVGAMMIVSHLTKNHYYTAYTQIFGITQITALIQWSAGGLLDSGLPILWSICGPIAALALFPARRAAIVFALYLVNIVITVVFDDTFAAHGTDLPYDTQRWFFLMNAVASSIVLFLFAAFFMRTATTERSRANALLLNILPANIAERLKSGERTIADHVDSASVLFADMVGSTPLMATLTPQQAVEMLNEVYSLFDELVAKHGLEKLRTVGDGYIVAAGVPMPRADHATACVALALDMIDALRTYRTPNGHEIHYRIGINSGPLMAGVIGEHKFQYDIWGDTVNTASRMESHGEVGRVHISPSTHELVRDVYECESRGTHDIKGKGLMETWFVVGTR
jgi:guanylate cyclase